MEARRESGPLRRETVSIPPDRSFLWRRDDYPTRRAVWNCHPEVEIHLIRHSSGLAFVGDYIGPFAGGDLYLIGSHLPHNWVTPDLDTASLPGRDLVVQFDPDPILRGCAAFPELGAVPDLLERAARGIRFTGATARTGRDIVETLGAVSPGEGATRLLGLLHLLASTAEHHLLASPGFVRRMRQASGAEQDKIECALTFIQENFLACPSLKEVARMTQMSETAFSRLFKHRTGDTFTEYLVSLRIGTAMRLLATSNEAITEICYLSGFNNISNFNRTFLRRTGMAPSSYRKASRRRT